MKTLEAEMLASADQQLSQTDPDARSMMTTVHGSGMVGYNVQSAVETEHHLIVEHEVTNTGSDRDQLSKMAIKTKRMMQTDQLLVVADRGYFEGEQLLACHDAGIETNAPRTERSNAVAEGRFGKQDFIYDADKD